jgi:hypothetical protein
VTYQIGFLTGSVQKMRRRLRFEVWSSRIRYRSTRSAVATHPDKAPTYQARSTDCTPLRTNRSITAGSCYKWSTCSDQFIEHNQGTKRHDRGQVNPAFWIHLLP